MLRLERMEVSGFKSFPDRTTIEFPDGITAVVGPNGCGKSNIADAVQWVLGEQSARALRGSKMEDVIFNGTQERGPGGMAEVTLHLVGRHEDPENGRRQVMITRRLFRTGESEYLVDGKKSRLADIRDILDDIRAGVRTYAIIDQTQVASFVVSKPKERRIFIEEAAGIANYKGRRRLAELKLEATQANLLRVDDILREVDRQRRSLQRQASLARRARRLDEEHRALRSYWFATRGRELRRRRDEAVEALAVARREAEHLERERGRLLDRLAELRAEVEAAHAGREESIAAQHRLELDEQRLERAVEAARARAAMIVDEAGRSEGERRRQDEDRALRGRELAAREADLAAADAELLEAERILAAARQALESARRDLAAEQSDADRVERELYEQLHSRADLGARLAAAREAASQEEARAAEAAAAGERLAAAAGAACEAVGAAEARFKECGVEADRLAREVEQARRIDEQAAQRLEDARGDEARLAAVLGGKVGEKAALDSLSVRLAGAEAARTVLEQAREGRLQARSVIADLIRVEREVEQAAEAFLSEALPAIVVETTADVVRGAELVDAGRVSFLPLDAGANGDMQRSYAELPPALASDARVLGRLASRVAATGDTDGVITSRLDDALLVTDLAAALELHRRFPHWNFLTREGHAVRASGVVTIEGQGESRKDGLLARARRREDLARELAELGQEQVRSTRRLDEARAALQAAQAARRETEEQLSAARREADAARIAWEQAGRELGRVEREQALLSAVRETADRGRAEAQERAAAIAADLEAVERSVNERRVAREQVRESVRRQEESVREAGAQAARLEAERAARADRRATLGDDVERRRREILDLDLRSADAAEARRLAEEEARRLLAQADADANALDDARRRRDEAGSAVQRWESDLSLRAEQVRDAEARVARAEDELDAARGRRERLALEAGRLEADDDHLRTACREELKLEPEDLPVEAPAGADPELLADESRLSARVADLRERRERVGPVNPLAEQEFADLSARCAELTRQRDDLHETIEELTHSIRKMDKESRERFLEAFGEIRRHFREQFALLFRGGRADLVLDDEENPLECGIEILCQPPGKKLQAVSLLSGGEKALAATAVLFAIFKHQPPPFCLLDEVDAPLDDANVNRFVEAIRSFASATQFIMITHNKRSMELADILYGVTMPEPGVSRVVSMTMH